MISKIFSLSHYYFTLATLGGERISCTQLVTAYHGSSHCIREFDRSKTVDGTFWFSEDVGKILRGESGAASIKWLIKVELRIDKVAGWEEYDQYYLDQLESMGYSAVHLDDDWIVFDPSRIHVIGAKRI